MFGVLYTSYVVLIDSTKQVGAVGLLAVLTVSVFHSLHEHFFQLVPLIYEQRDDGTYSVSPPCWNCHSAY